MDVCEIGRRGMFEVENTQVACSTVLLCSCGNKAIGTHKDRHFCLYCVEGATPKEIMDGIPVIEDMKFIDYLKTIGTE